MTETRKQFVVFIEEPRNYLVLAADENEAIELALRAATSEQLETASAVCIHRPGWRTSGFGVVPEEQYASSTLPVNAKPPSS